MPGIIAKSKDFDLRPAPQAERPNGRRRSCGAARRADARAGD
jgi:hypothetical protein